MHEDILLQDEEWPIFFYPKRQENRPRYEAFEQTRVSPLTEPALDFLRREKILPRSDGEHREHWLAVSSNHVPRVIKPSNIRSTS